MRNPRRDRPRISHFLTTAFMLQLLVPFGASAQDDAPPQWIFDVGTGARVFHDDSMENVYGTGLVILGGVSYVLEPGWSALRVDLTYRGDEGEELQLDDTFEVDPSRNDSVSLALGIRFGPETGRDKPVTMRAGFGGELMWSSWRPPVGDRESDWIPGVWADVSPRIYVTSGWEAWAMFRVCFSKEQELDGGFEAFDHDDFNFLVGVSRVAH